MYKYLLIDDDDEIADFAETLSETARHLNISISIEFFNPKNNINSWDTIIEKITQIDSCYSGIITDQRLDGEDARPNGLKYRGTSLSQNIRTFANESKIKSFPIILYYAPTLENASHSLFKDTRGIDLFDLKYNKDEVEFNHYSQLIKELFALSDAYTRIAGEQSINDLLKIQNIDSRIMKILERKRNSTHEFALFFESEILFTPGILIDEDILAARLGVDKNCADWAVLKEKLRQVRLEDADERPYLEYKGVFSSAWERWWNENLLQWWKKITRSRKALSTYNANERVAILNQVFTLNLEPLQVSWGRHSDYFWTTCIYTKIPIDPIDGVMTNKSISYFWQDIEYVSKKYIKDNLSWDGYNLIDSEVVQSIRR